MYLLSSFKKQIKLVLPTIMFLIIPISHYNFIAYLSVSVGFNIKVIDPVDSMSGYWQPL